jgi:hypothetical protein
VLVAASFFLEPLFSERIFTGLFAFFYRAAISITFQFTADSSSAAGF